MRIPIIEDTDKSFKKGLQEVITFVHNKETYSLRKSTHVLDYRYNGSKYFRDEHISDDMYIDIMKHAITNGLRSFNKKVVVLTLKNYAEHFVSILCTIKDNSIKVISVYQSKNAPFWKVFIKCNYRIYLVNNYTIPKMKQPEMKKKRNLKIRHEVEKYAKTQDSVFRDWANLTGIKRI